MEKSLQETMNTKMQRILILWILMRTRYVESLSIVRMLFKNPCI